MNDGCYLILSGFYVEDIPVLLEKAKELGLSEIERKSDNNWACLILKTNQLLYLLMTISEVFKEILDAVNKGLHPTIY